MSSPRQPIPAETIAALFAEYSDRYRYLALRSLEGPVQVGDVLWKSYCWEDNECTGQLLDGTCGMSIDDRCNLQTLDRIGHEIIMYAGDHVVLIGSDYQGRDYAVDPGEIILREPEVLAILV